MFVPTRQRPPQLCLAKKRQVGDGGGGGFLESKIGTFGEA